MTRSPTISAPTTRPPLPKRGSPAKRSVRENFLARLQLATPEELGVLDRELHRLELLRAKRASDAQWGEEPETVCIMASARLATNIEAQAERAPAAAAAAAESDPYAMIEVRK